MAIAGELTYNINVKDQGVAKSVNKASDGFKKLEKQANKTSIALGNKLTSNLKKLDNRFQSLDTKIDTFTKKIATASNLLASAALFGIGKLGAGFVQAGADAVETQNRFEAVFKGLEKDAEDFANTLAKQIGRAPSAIKDGLASFQGFAVGLGFAKEEAFKLSTDLQILALDFASFNNLSDGEAQQRFISALSGSGEVLDRFGINIKQNALDLKLLDLGFKTSTQGATEAEKAIARYNIILETMTSQGAVGDATKTALSFANQLKRLQGNFTILSERIGGFLIVALNPLLIGINKLSTILLEVPLLVEALTIAVAGLAAMITTKLIVSFTRAAIQSGLLTINLAKLNTQMLLLQSKGIAGAVKGFAVLGAKILGITAIILGLGIALSATIRNWDAVVQSFKKGVEASSNLFKAFFGDFSSQWKEILFNGVKLYENFWKTIGKLAKAGGKALVDGIRGLITGKGFSGFNVDFNIAESFTQGLKEVDFSATKKALSEVGSFGKEAFSGTAKALKNEFDIGLKAVKGFGKKVGSSLEAGQQAFSILNNKIDDKSSGGRGNSTTDALKEAGKDVTKLVSTFKSELRSAQQAVDETNNKIKELTSEFKDASDQAKEAFVSDVLDDYIDKQKELADVQLAILRGQEASAKVNEGTARRLATELQNQIDAERELAELKAKRLAGEKVESEISNRVDGEIVKQKVLIDITDAQIKAAEARVLAADKIVDGIVGENTALKERAELLQQEAQLLKDSERLKGTADRAGLDAGSFNEQLKAATIDSITDEITLREQAFIAEQAQRQAEFDERLSSLQTRLATEKQALESFKSLETELFEQRIAQEDAITGEIVAQTNIREKVQIDSLNRIIVKLKEAIALRQSLSGGGGRRRGGRAMGGMVPGFAKGGFTQGGAAQVAGVVHGGEYVAPKWQVNSMRSLFTELDNNRKGGTVSNNTTNNYTINNQSSGSMWNDMAYIKFATKYA